MGRPIYRKTGSASVSFYALAILPKTVVAVRGLGQVPFAYLFVGAWLLTLLVSGASWLNASTESTRGSVNVSSRVDITLIQWATVLIISVFSLLLSVGLFRAMRAAPRLPDVKITLSDSERTVVGKLLDHSGGTWHFFDEDWKLKAIPDGQVKIAEIYEKSDEAPSSNKA
jgi:hypothetical protein